jgi:hypothetical protein
VRSRFAVEPVYSDPHAGAGGTRVNFVLATAAEGRKVLIELVEPPPRRKSKSP